MKELDLDRKPLLSKRHAHKTKQASRRRASAPKADLVSKAALADWQAEFAKQHELGEQLLRNIKARLQELEKLLQEVSSHWHAEDRFYRFYHQSFKVYWLQQDTAKVVEALKSLLPKRPLNTWFEKIVKEGTGKQFKDEHNRRWLAETRPILEAFFHARTMLEFAIQYGRQLDAAPTTLPSGWAAVLYLYDLR
jgi:hypothetical protein